MLLNLYTSNSRKMNPTFSKLIKVTGFLILLGASIYYTTQIVTPDRSIKPWDVSSKIIDFYEIEENSLDIVFVESSHTFCPFDPYIFQNKPA